MKGKKVDMTMVVAAVVAVVVVHFLGENYKRDIKMQARWERTRLSSWQKYPQSMFKFSA